MIAVLTVTLATRGGPGGTNLVPLRGIASQVTNVNGTFGALNLLGNVVMFVPLGLLAPAATGWRGRRVVAVALVLSAAIEVTQIALGRSADVDDVLLNTIGATVGVGAVLAVARMRHVGARVTAAPPGPAT